MAHLGNIVLLAHIYCSLYSMLGKRLLSTLLFESYHPEKGRYLPKILYIKGGRGSALGQEAGPEPGYGSEWLLFVDERGSTHTMNFSSVPSDQRGMLFGDAYFHLYTRYVVLGRLRSKHTYIENIK